MSLPQFDELPFNARPDLSPYLIHLTKNTKREDQYSAFDNLVSILKLGKIFGSDSSKGFIKGPHKAACFMDIPFQALKYVLTPENADPQRPRYEPYGVVITKGYAYRSGCRPVLYLSNDETKKLGIPKGELWRVVRFEVKKDGGWISWLHEREWRCKGSFRMPSSIQAVLVRNTKDAARLSGLIADEPDEFKSKPRSIIPLTVISQGLLAPKLTAA